MKIKQGFHIKQHIENMNTDKYLLVLEVDKKIIKSVNYGGTPTDSLILNYEDVIADGFTIDVLSDKDVVCLTKYETYLKNGIPASYPIAVNYKWSNKEYTIPLKSKYWNGSKWDYIPCGFYK